MQGYHDVGGKPNRDPIDRAEPRMALWEKRVDAVRNIMASKGLTTTDESRRAIESMGEKAYTELTYTERRLAAFAQNLMLRGVVTVDELSRKMQQVEARERSKS